MILEFVKSFKLEGTHKLCMSHGTAKLVCALLLKDYYSTTGYNVQYVLLAEV